MLVQCSHLMPYSTRKRELELQARRGHRILAMMRIKPIIWMKMTAIPKFGQYPSLHKLTHPKWMSPPVIGGYEMRYHESTQSIHMETDGL